MTATLLATAVIRGTMRAEGGGEQTSVPQPWLMGVLAFAILATALFLVTRLNKDR